VEYGFFRVLGVLKVKVTGLWYISGLNCYGVDRSVYNVANNVSGVDRSAGSTGVQKGSTIAGLGSTIAGLGLTIAGLGSTGVQGRQECKKGQQ
jgi:hypothetical protein